MPTVPCDQEQIDEQVAYWETRASDNSMEMFLDSLTCFDLSGAYLQSVENFNDYAHLFFGIEYCDSSVDESCLADHYFPPADDQGEPRHLEEENHQNTISILMTSSFKQIDMENTSEPIKGVNLGLLYVSEKNQKVSNRV